MRSAKRAASKQLGETVAAAGEGHPAQNAFSNAQEWAARTKEAIEAGDDGKAAMFADNAKRCARATRSLLRGKRPKDRYPDASDDTLLHAPVPVPPPEEDRTARALAGAAGIGGRARVMPPREDGGRTAAWNDKDFGGAATVYPGTGDDAPHARVVFHRLDRDRYQALADSPWPYRVENGQVIYDRVPADHAEQIIRAARSCRPAKPWERHGFTDNPNRNVLHGEQADRLVPESQEWAAGLTLEQRKWVKSYTGMSYHAINKHLYEGRSLDEGAGGIPTPMREVTGHLDSAIASAGVSDTQHHVFRGFTPPMEVRRERRVASWVRENFAVGSRYRDDSYMSVTHCPRVAAEFTDDTSDSGWADYGVVFESVTRRGAALAEVSIFDNAERERLMPRGAEWVVVGVQEGVKVDGKACMVVQMADAKDAHRY
ncbi:ADP-ribosyltransferase [Streptomyces yaizuensis]|uniref:ADP-ribosyltransferase domain-containing protein n=1 Tax=Streptomyces yaizuensis TaxID=2989713 RepID=A0ABQ5P631_9ACTN|nr:ADP-ribosyltransferase [Streptomyces sp. YSPA8]GLF98037.1 ADP-ribosyltransferase domain-containing protein [Streptomyces sp. YSPA8]